MGLVGRIALASAVSAAVLFASSAALADITVGKNGESHDSVWQVSDLGLYLDGSLLALPDVGEVVASALQSWNDADARLPHVWPFLGQADSTGYRSGQTNRNTLRFAVSGYPDAKGALAITLVSYDSEKKVIKDADIVVNGIYKFADLNPHVGQSVPSKAYDISDILLHELGHFFGLPDNYDDSSAVMYPYFDPGETRNHSVSDSDKQALDDLYAAGTAPPAKTASCSVGHWGHTQRSSDYLLAGSLILGLARIRRNATRSPVFSSASGMAKRPRRVPAGDP
jgi:hypothetical protein